MQDSVISKYRQLASENENLPQNLKDYQVLIINITLAYFLTHIPGGHFGINHRQV